MVKTPKEVVTEAVRIAKEYEERLAEIDQQRKEIVASTIKGAEMTKMQQVREFIYKLFEK